MNNELYSFYKKIMKKQVNKQEILNFIDSADIEDLKDFSKMLLDINNRGFDDCRALPYMMDAYYERFLKSHMGNCAEPDLDLTTNSDEMKKHIVGVFSAKGYSHLTPFLVIDHFEGKTYESQVNWFHTVEEIKEHISGCRKDFPENYVLDDVFEVQGYRKVNVDEF